MNTNTIQEKKNPHALRHAGFSQKKLSTGGNFLGACGAWYPQMHPRRRDLPSNIESKPLLLQDPNKTQKERMHLMYSLYL